MNPCALRELASDLPALPEPDDGYVSNGGRRRPLSRRPQSATLSQTIGRARDDQRDGRIARGSWLSRACLLRRSHAPRRAEAARKLAASFPVELGRFSGEQVGPHPVPQFQVIFKTDAFESVVPWLMLNREGLDILVHPLTDDMVDDHTVYALWLGSPIKLKLDTMQRRGYSEALLPKA